MKCTIHARLLVMLSALFVMLASGCVSDAPGGPSLPSGGGIFPAAGSAIIAGHESVRAFDSIPESYFGNVRSQYRIYYGHTSHGSQVMSGISELSDENPTLYASPVFHEPGGDLGGTGDTAWAQATRNYLDSHPDYNVVMWSWCGGVSGNTQAGIDAYLDAMESLEDDYPGVTFVYMTGHLDGSGSEGNLHARNEQIRKYCRENGKVLFDFADIETFSPDGVNHIDDPETDACNWCGEWCSPGRCGCGCAHSNCFNCYQKGKAFWWMMARIAGWN